MPYHLSGQVGANRNTFWSSYEALWLLVQPIRQKSPAYDHSLI